MGQILHGCAKTTYSTREAIQRSKASISELSRAYNINPKTVIKWRSRKEEGVQSYFYLGRLIVEHDKLEHVLQKCSDVKEAVQQELSKKC